MASLIAFQEQEKPAYIDREWSGTQDELKELESKSSTVYVSKYAFTDQNAVTESQIYIIFSRACGAIKRVHMGVNKQDMKRSAGFCFVEFFTRRSALAAINYMNKTRFGGKDIVVNIDRGFEDGRQYGRGASGYQRSDEFTRKLDPERDIGIENQRRGGGYARNRPSMRERRY